MAYFIPLRMLKIGPNFAIPVHKIASIGSIASGYLKQLVKQRKKDKTLIDATGPLLTKTVIILDNGAVCTSPTDIEVLVKNINDMQRMDMKETGFRLVKKGKKNETDTNSVSVEELMRTIKESLNGDEEENDEDEDEANTDT